MLYIKLTQANPYNSALYNNETRYNSALYNKIDYNTPLYRTGDQLSNAIYQTLPN